MTTKLMRSTIAAAALAATSLAATSLAAQAADMPVKAPVYKAPPMVAVYSWTGWYAGANAGYSWRDPSIDFAGNAAAAPFFASGYFPRSVTVNPRGYLAGLQAGYNMQSGNVVYGFETDLDWASIKDRGSASGIPFIDTGTGNCDANICVGTGTIMAEQKLGWLGTVRGRLGMLATPTTLLYATGGLAYGYAALTASVNSVVTNTGGPTVVCRADMSAKAPCAAGSISNWRTGWTLGGGLEYAFDPRWSLKGEYLYYDLGSMSVSFADPRNGTSYTATAGYRGHIARAGVNYKF
jgi:outer membrane immunogenic protein